LPPSTNPHQNIAEETSTNQVPTFEKWE